MIRCMKDTRTGMKIIILLQMGITKLFLNLPQMKFVAYFYEI